MVSGVIIGGFGFGSFIFNFVSTAIINPDNVSPVNGIYQRHVTDNVPYALRIFAIVWLAIASTSINLLRPKESRVKNESQVNDSEILQTKKFWLLYFMNFSSVFLGYIVVSNYKVFG